MKSLIPCIETNVKFVVFDQFNTLGGNMKSFAKLNMLLVAALSTTSVWAQVPPSFDVTQMPVGFAPRPAITSVFVGSGNEYQFFAWHTANKFKGNLDAYKLDTSGKVTGDPVWRASTKIITAADPAATPPVAEVKAIGALDGQDHTARKIVTLKGAAKVPFDSANFKTVTSLGATGANDAVRTNVINFLRGDRSLEKTATNTAGIFRERGSALGDIMHSSPVFVGAPRGGDGTKAYSDFRNANANRARRIYVGANDGMVHAFDAGTFDTTKGTFPDGGTGQEVFAYIPSMLIPRLKDLSALDYNLGKHQYYVDGGLTSRDVVFSTDNAWHTVLVGTLGAGGKGLYALDVTNPSPTSAADAANKILWEITPSTRLSGSGSTTTSVANEYPDLGDTFSEPVLAKLNDGSWAMVVGNGYNSGTGKAMLYLINPANGSQIAAIQAGTSTTSGLSSPAVYDIDGNGTIDYVYAGDIQGKLWRFDLKGNSPATWKTNPVAEINLGGNTQPIVAAPAVLPHPQGGLMVNFATGAYFNEGDSPAGWDIANDAVQNYAYGIWDGAPASATALQTQTITHADYTYTPVSGTATTVKVMTSSANVVNYIDATSLHRGWKAALPLGASVPSNGYYTANGRFTFAMSNPSATTADEGSWLMQLDYLTGGPAKIIFDLNQDGLYDNYDRTNSTTLDGTTVPVGISLGTELVSQPVYSSLGPKLDKVLYTAFQPGTPPRPVPVKTEPGLVGGHFDFDSYTVLGAGKDKHVHEYDDKFDATGVDMLNNKNVIEFDLDHPVEGALINSYNNAAASNRFFFVVANGDLSKLATIRVNKTIYTAPEFPNIINDLTKRNTYRLADLENLSIELPRDALEKYGLHPTVTGCVNGSGSVQAVPGDAVNQMVGGTPGKEKAWRNGALTVLVVKADAPAAAFRQNVSGKPEKGYVLRNSHASSLLREYTIFWHASVPCHQNATWTASPPLNYGTGGSTPIAGSTDPGNGNNPYIDSITCETKPTPPTAADAVAGAATYTVCTTVYSDGKIYQTITAKTPGGEILSSVGKLIPPKDDDLSTGGIDGAQCAKCTPPPNPKGKLTGRVNWSEKFRSK
jgi:Neisseria PilC beta-propeller domain